MSRIVVVGGGIGGLVAAALLGRAGHRVTLLEANGWLGPEVTRLLTTDPLDRRTFPALRRLLRVYGAKLTTRSYLDGLRWLPEGLREIIAIHALNARVAPTRTPALYASMPAVMAVDGVFVPEGGVYEVVLGLERLARRARVEVRRGEPVNGIGPGKVTSAEAEYRADAVVSGLDADRLEGILDSSRKLAPKKLSCSGVAVYAALRERLPAGIATHGVVLPSEPAALYASLEAGEPATEYFEEHKVLHPRYFGAWGSAGGALYGATRPFWRSGPLHRPRYSDRWRPWLWRVGASVHPGGGIPAVLGGGHDLHGQAAPVSG